MHHDCPSPENTKIYDEIMVDDKQFIILASSQKDRNIVNVFLNDRQRELALSCGSMLVYEKKLNVCCNEDCTAVLIGDAWQVHPSKDCPENIIKTFSGGTTIEDGVDAMCLL